ncbi:hypothetical protein [Streptomyces sp. 900105245]
MADLDVVVPSAGGGVERIRTPAILLPMSDALPLLTRARELPDSHRSLAPA